MCDPLTIGAAALQGTSLLLNNAASNQAMAARAGVLTSEGQRQAGYDNEASNLNAQSRGRYGNFTGDMGGKIKQLSDFYAANSNPVPQGGSTTSGSVAAPSSNIVVQEEKKQLGKVSDFNTQQNDALAGLRSFGDTLAGTTRGQAEDAANLGIVNSFKNGSSSLVPLELQQANNAGNGLRTLSSILGGVGSVGLTAGLSGWDPFGSARNITIKRTSSVVS